MTLMEYLVESEVDDFFGMKMKLTWSQVNPQPRIPDPALPVRVPGIFPLCTDTNYKTMYP